MRSDAAQRALPPLIALVAFTVAWASLARVLDVPPVVLPSPLEVTATLVAIWPTLLRDGAVTGATAALGLLAGTTVGFALACGVVASPALERAVMPYVVALRIAPIVALGPLFFLLFGRGVLPRAALVSTITLFPVTVSSIEGLRDVPPAYLDVARAVGAPKWRVFLQVRAPVAARSIFAGVKLAAALSVVGAVVAEFVTLTSGLGYRVFVTASRLQTTKTFAALVALAVLGVGFYGAPALLERVSRTPDEL